MNGRDNTLTANGLEHQLQFHCMLSRTCTAYFELATSTEAVKSLQYLSSLCLAISLANTSGPKSQKLLNSGLPITRAADPNPARISARTKWLLPSKHKIKHDQDKQVQKAEEKIIFKSKSADLTETPSPADLQNKAVLFLHAVISSKARFLTEQSERSWRDKGRCKIIETSLKNYQFKKF